MKVFFKIIGFIILGVLLMAFILPLLFKGKINNVAKEEINKNVNATVDFEDVSLSLFNNFPNFTLGLNGLSVAGKEIFENDTLANIKSIEVVIDLMSVLGSDQYEIKRISIIQPDLVVRVLEDGQSNYDIALAGEDSSEPESEATESSAFNLSLKKFEIVDGSIQYFDESLNMDLIISGMNHTLKGDFSADQTKIQTKTEIQQMDVVYDGIKYLNKASLQYNANIDADLINEIFTLKKNELKINELYVQFDGSVSMINDEDISLIMTFNSAQTDFKHILSLVPAVYTKDFESVETSGKLELDGHVKGIYNEESLPAFALNLKVENAMFKYPDLPKAVEDINIITKISNKGGSADNTIIDISRFHFKMGQNPVDMKMILKTPESDPYIDAKIRGKLDMGSIKEFYPLEEGEELSGSMLFDITLKGNLSAIEEERYAEFTSLGSVLLNDMKYKSSYFNDPVEIINTQLNFSPAYLDLVSLKLKIGKNDFKAAGKIRNYLPYILADDKLVGILKTSSDYLNVTTLIPEDSTDDAAPETDEAYELSVVDVPANIDFQMSSSFKKLIYDNIEMNNVKGNIVIRDQRIHMKDLYVELLDGDMTLDGYYDARNIEKPNVNMDLTVNNFDIQKAYNTFDLVSKYAPIAAKTSGKFSTSFNYKSELDNEMMPVYESMNGQGTLKTGKISIVGVNTLDKIADAIKYDKLKKMDINKIHLSFKFIDGKILVDPFEMNQGNLKSTVGGWTGLDQQIDYVMNLSLPRNELGSAANGVLNNLVNEANSKGANFSLGDVVTLDALIGGSLTDPVITTGLSDMGKNLIEDVKTQVKEEIKKKKEEVSKEAKEKAQKLIDDADAQAQKLIKEAEKQAAGIRKSADEAARQLRDEADKQAIKVESEGKNNGPIAHFAAKESAKKIRSEADKQANNLTTEADKQATAVVNKAKSEAAKIKSNAQKVADELLEVK